MLLFSARIHFNRALCKIVRPGATPFFPLQVAVFSPALCPQAISALSMLLRGFEVK